MSSEDIYMYRRYVGINLYYTSTIGNTNQLILHINNWKTNLTVKEVIRILKYLREDDVMQI